MKKIGLLITALLLIAIYGNAYNVSGIVIDSESGDALPGLELILLTEGGWVKTTTTQADGTFTFTNVQNGSNELEFHYYTTVVINGTYYLRSLYGDPIIVNGEDITDLIFRIDPHNPNFQIKGTLYDAVTNLPLSNQNNSLRLDFFSHSGFFFAWCEDDGSFSFNDLVPDWTYYFDVFDNDYYFGEQVEITIDPTGPEEIIVDFYLQPKDGVSVTGQLFDVETNQPILMANRTIRITAINSLWAETNENGEFTFVNVEPGYYANIKVTSEDTAYIKCSESTIIDLIVPEEGLGGVELFQKKFETVHEVTVDDNSFVPGEIKSLTFSLVLDDLIYGEIWGVELLLPPNLNALNTTAFINYASNNTVFEREYDCSYPDRLVWEGHHTVYGIGNVGNLQVLNDSVFADVEFQFDDSANENNIEIFYKVFYGYSCVWQPFSFGTIVLENANLSVGLDETQEHISKISSFPNPSSVNTTFRFSLNQPSAVNIVLYDITGQVVIETGEGDYGEGSNEIMLDTSGLSEGIYFYKIETDDQVLSNKLIISR